MPVKSSVSNECKEGAKRAVFLPFFSDFLFFEACFSRSSRCLTCGGKCPLHGKNKYGDCSGRRSGKRLIWQALPQITSVKRRNGSKIDFISSEFFDETKLRWGVVQKTGQGVFKIAMLIK